MTDAEFKARFKELTGHKPLRWQERLFHHYFAQNSLPNVIDLPTGLGKTMVMAIWLIARGVNKNVPRRLVYVVDRRTVVDQATDIAMRLVMRPMTKWIHGHFDGQPPTISTLRGQLADNREWSRDPSRPAIIIGTVDLIGSALLFSGYRSSYKRRPLEAGLLGQDSLLVLDEAHLSKPFEKLITSITQFQHGHGSPMRVVRMSATSGDDTADRFKLEVGDLADPVIKQRFEATKRIQITTLGDKDKLNDKLKDNAIDLAANMALFGKRIVIFVRRPDDAAIVADLIRKYIVKTEDASGKPVKATPYADSVETLTGTIRGIERDELVEKPILKRFLDGYIDPADAANKQPVFLISTSAGEVGFDLNADHMVCDAAPLDSMIQRLGRVNRRGEGDATVRMVTEKEPKIKSDIDAACVAASNLFRNDMDVSPRALAEFKSTLSADQMKAASTPRQTHTKSFVVQGLGQDNRYSNLPC
ncbi:MAG: type I-U CRISPR-associated helicase/endonuclease Cas3, partial [Planctomycetota bacterium]|nr:type I-U CRISPR-associated helicase/endonuclease Cas3 [Planctomycetota bacterium]